MIRSIVIACLLAGSALAETAVAARTIPARTILGPEDILMRAIDVPGGVQDQSQIIGLEARVALYAGRPIRPADLGFPATIERNQIIPLIYQNGGLIITTDGRALDRAGPGDLIRVMNLNSRATVTALIGVDGAAHVSY